MKKALAMALGGLLLASPAFAASEVDFSGQLRTVFANEWRYNEDSANDSGFFNRLELNMSFNATDEVSVHWQLRAPDHQRWGVAGQNNAETIYAYGEIKQDWGTIVIGRLSDDFTYYGLENLGWYPEGTDDLITDWGIFDPGGEADGITYINRWDSGFQLVAQYLRMDDSFDTNGSSQTNDWFIVQPSFHWDGGGASLGFLYNRNHVSHGPPPGIAYDEDDPAMKAFFLNPAVAHSFGDFSLHFEGMVGWGKDDADDQKHRGLGLYLDGDYNYGPGNVTLAGWWLSGSKVDGGGKINNLVTPGAFAPLIVAYGGFIGDAFNPPAAIDSNAIHAANDAANMPNRNAHSTANHWGLALAGSHSFTEDLALKYTVGHLSLNKVEPGAKKSIGTEADLGLAINLLDNLEFRSTFGYLWVGDAFKDLGTGNKPKDMYSWYNTLYFSF